LSKLPTFFRAQRLSVVTVQTISCFEYKITKELVVHWLTCRQARGESWKARARERDETVQARPVGLQSVAAIFKSKRNEPMMGLPESPIL
jgi:hypothetical protein